MSTTTRAGGVNAADVPAKDLPQAEPLSSAEVPAPPPSTTSRVDGDQMSLPTSGGQEVASGARAGEGAAPEVRLRGDADITITAYGTPIPQGSLSSLGKGRPAVYSNAKRLKPWRKLVRQAAADVLLAHEPLTGPVRAHLLFCFDRPASHYRTGRNAHRLREAAPSHPIGRGYGDSEKLVRAVCDSLTDAGIWTDDSQVVDLRARKVWAGDEEALRHAGVHIRLREVP